MGGRFSFARYRVVGSVTLSKSLAIGAAVVYFGLEKEEFASDLSDKRGP